MEAGHEVHLYDGANGLRLPKADGVKIHLRFSGTAVTIWYFYSNRTFDLADPNSLVDIVELIDKRLQRRK